MQHCNGAHGHHQRLKHIVLVLLSHLARVVMVGFTLIFRLSILLPDRQLIVERSAQTPLFAVRNITKLAVMALRPQEQLVVTDLERFIPTVFVQVNVNQDNWVLRHGGTAASMLMALIMAVMPVRDFLIRPEVSAMALVSCRLAPGQLAAFPLVEGQLPVREMAR